MVPLAVLNLVCFFFVCFAMGWMVDKMMFSLIFSVAVSTLFISTLCVLYCSITISHLFPFYLILNCSDRYFWTFKQCSLLFWDTSYGANGDAEAKKAVVTEIQYILSKNGVAACHGFLVCHLQRRWGDSECELYSLGHSSVRERSYIQLNVKRQWNRKNI